VVKTGKFSIDFP